MMENKLSRRKFIGLLGGAAVIASVPISFAGDLYANYMDVAPALLTEMEPFKAIKEPGSGNYRFYPDQEYGNAFPLLQDIDGYAENVWKLLLADAKVYIPGKYRHKIQLRKKMVTFSNKSHECGIAWYYFRLNKPCYLGKRGHWKLNELGGFYLWERGIG